MGKALKKLLELKYFGKYTLVFNFCKEKTSLKIGILKLLKVPPSFNKITR